ncbi:MAG: PD40 domain-containing protein [Bacteroidales bacterium]|nr:PD40 domain-containing protein [Bacteroidales bacterium]
MKRYILSLCVAGIVSLMFLSATAQDAHFLSYPSLSPDAKTLVFSFEGDLWQADMASGEAMRLTAMQGYETGAKFSPDGKWIAFTSKLTF